MGEEFSGIWRCTHWYPSNEHLGDDFDEHEMRVHAEGKDIIFESLPQEDGSYMFVRLTIEDAIATGTWNESAAINGPYKGAQYSGAGQLVISPDKTSMVGKWAGAGYDHKLKEMRIYTGNWEISRLDSDDHK